MDNKTIFELMGDIGEINKLLKRKYENLQFLKDIDTEPEKIEEYKVNMSERETEKADLLQQIQKINKGKNITIDHNGEYDRHIMTIIFPEGTSKQFKRKWLCKNNLATHNEYYEINSQYDCIGQVHTVYTKYKKNKVVITKLFDL